MAAGIDNIPEDSLGPHTKVLHDKPDTNSVVRVLQPECAPGTIAYEVPGEHPLDRTTRGA